MNILLTGGAGYIGCHTAVVLSEAGHEVVVLDNFCNSNSTAINGVEKILGRKLSSIEADVRDTPAVEKALCDYKIDAVIHFAGLKSVGESVFNPILYYFIIGIVLIIISIPVLIYLFPQKYKLIKIKWKNKKNSY